MTEKELKKMLSGYPYILEEIKECNEKICDLSRQVTAEREVSTVLQDGMPKMHGVKSDPTYRAVERILCNYLREVERIEGRKEELLARKSYIERIMEKLRFEERKIIELRYFKKYRWGMVASAMNYSERHCHNIHRSGIKNAVESTESYALAL